MRKDRSIKLSNQLSYGILGVLESAWAPMVPYVKSSMQLDDAQFGRLLFCLGDKYLGCHIHCKRFGLLRHYVRSDYHRLYFKSHVFRVLLYLFGLCSSAYSFALNQSVKKIKIKDLQGICPAGLLSDRLRLEDIVRINHRSVYLCLCCIPTLSFTLFLSALISCSAILRN